MKNALAILLIVTATLLSTTGCGTLMFSERQQQSQSVRLDPNILILDGLGLLFFLVPGLVDFGVDFYTGAVYLPPGVENGEGPFVRDPVELHVESD